MVRHPHPRGLLDVVQLRAESPSPIHGLRALLKIALRRGFRCISVEQAVEEGREHVHDKTKGDLAD